MDGHQVCAASSADMTCTQSTPFRGMHACTHTHTHTYSHVFWLLMLSVESINGTANGTAVCKPLSQLINSSITYGYAMSFTLLPSLFHTPPLLHSFLPLMNLHSCSPSTSPSPSAPQFFVSFFQQFPYSLPCLVNAVFCLIGLLAVIFLLPETLHKKLVAHSLSTLTAHTVYSHDACSGIGNIFQ